MEHCPQCEAARKLYGPGTVCYECQQRQAGQGHVYYCFHCGDALALDGWCDTCDGNPRPEAVERDAEQDASNWQSGDYYNG
jgi:RecJ-like exonuclease